MAVSAYDNGNGLAYPLTKMNFYVHIDGVEGANAAFSEVTGIEASVDVIEFRQGECQQSGTGKDSGAGKAWKCYPEDGIYAGQRIQDMAAGMCK